MQESIKNIYNSLFTDGFVAAAEKAYPEWDFTDKFFKKDPKNLEYFQSVINDLQFGSINIDTFFWFKFMFVTFTVDFDAYCSDNESEDGPVSSGILSSDFHAFNYENGWIIIKEGIYRLYL